MTLPSEILSLILSFHWPVVQQEFSGNPQYTLYWRYNKAKLKAYIQMTQEFKVVTSGLGQFLRRNKETAKWLGVPAHNCGKHYVGLERNIDEPNGFRSVRL